MRLPLGWCYHSVVSAPAPCMTSARNKTETETNRSDIAQEPGGPRPPCPDLHVHCYLHTACVVPPALFPVSDPVVYLSTPVHTVAVADARLGLARCPIGWSVSGNWWPRVALCNWSCPLQLDAMQSGCSGTKAPLHHISPSHVH